MALAMRQRTRSAPANNNLAKKIRRRNYRTEGTEITEGRERGHSIFPSTVSGSISLFLYCEISRALWLRGIFGLKPHGDLRGLRATFIRCCSSSPAIVLEALEGRLLAAPGWGI